MTQKRNLLWISIFLFFYIPNPIEAQNADVLVEVARANESYHEKDYQSAAKIFENLVTKGEENGYLFYNLGNTHMRLGNLGYAILNYLSAKTLLPRNENLNANLRYAISQTVDKINPPLEGFALGPLFWIESISLDEYFKLIFIFNIIFWSVSIGSLYFRKPWWSISKKISMGILLIIALSTGIKHYSQSSQAIGVILKSEVGVKSDRGIQNITLFHLHEGAIISIKQEEGDWINVSLDKEKSGWIPRKAIGY